MTHVLFTLQIVAFCILITFAILEYEFRKWTGRQLVELEELRLMRQRNEIGPYAYIIRAWWVQQRWIKTGKYFPLFKKIVRVMEVILILISIAGALFG